MAELNGRGGWDITDAEADEILRLSDERDAEVHARMTGADAEPRSWTDAYDDAPASPPANAGPLIEDSEDELRAIACALKPAAPPAGALTAAAMAGLVLAGLRSAGWDVTRMGPSAMAGGFPVQIQCCIRCTRELRS